jgi:hypothetical protein
LLSGGVAESWELVTDVVPNVSSRYRAVTTPPFAIAEGSQHLEDLGGGRTRVTFVETYTVRNRWLRFLERPVHRFISRDNDRLISEGINAGIAGRRLLPRHRDAEDGSDPSLRPAPWSADDPKSDRLRRLPRRTMWRRSPRL